MRNWTRACACAFIWLSISTNHAAAQETGSSSTPYSAAVCGRQTQKVCTPVPALGETVHIDFRNRSLGEYIAQVNGPLDFDTPKNKEDGKGLVLLLTGENDTPKVEVPQHIFFGRVDVEMRSAPGRGILTAMALVSPDGDEASFELRGFNDTTIQTSFLSKADTTALGYTAGASRVDGSSINFHTYSFLWGTKSLQWLIDGNVVRTLNYRKEYDGTNIGFPQAPMNIRIGSYVTGRQNSTPSAIEYGGGFADFTNGPKRTYIKTLKITDEAYNSPGRKPKFYTWNDLSGLYTSIGVKYEDGSVGVDNGTRTDTGAGEKTPTDMGAGKEPPTSSPATNVEPNGLSAGAIAGIVVGIVAALAMIGALVAVVVARRRRRAKRDEAARNPTLQENTGTGDGRGVDNKPELDGQVLAELSRPEDEEAQELEGKGFVPVEMSTDNDPRELPPMASGECEDVYYEQLRAMEVKKP